MSLTLADLSAFAAFYNMSSRRWRACIVVSDMFECVWVHSDCKIFSAVATIASAGVTNRFVIYLCLRNTVSDTPFALVEITHRSQQK